MQKMIEATEIDVKKVEDLKQELVDFPLSWELLSILVGRGVDTVNKIKTFLAPKLFDLTDPFTIHDMQKAVLRVKQAILKNQKILIYGDKDVDGQTSISLLKNILADYGLLADYYIPFDEGYGLHKSILPKLLEQNIDLVITVDCGITNVEEIAYLKENGVDIIITDHHEPLDVIPYANAVVNPKISGGKVKYLAGCGVVFYFGWALLISFSQYFDKILDYEFTISQEKIEEISRRLYPKISHKIFDLKKFFRIAGTDEEKNLKKIYWNLLLKNDYAVLDYFKKYISFAALGTISDIMPLVDDNRFIVKYGLHNLENSKIKGMKAWLEKLKCNSHKLSAVFVAWNLAPVLNSAGRMGQPELGVDFLCANSSEEAMQILKEIEGLNNSRRKVQARDIKTVEEMIKENSLIKDEDVVFVAHKSLDKNVTGIVANNIMKKYGKPAFVIAKDENKSVGSTRAPKGYDMVSWFESCKDLLQRFGGHKLAGGFTINNENISEFRDQILEISKRESIEKQDVRAVDLVIEANKLNSHFLKEIFMLEPFGHCNKSPVILFKDCEFYMVEYLGMSKDHLKGKIKVLDNLIEVIGWSMSDRVEYIRSKGIVDMMGSIEKNYYNGKAILRINILVGFIL